MLLLDKPAVDPARFIGFCLIARRRRWPRCISAVLTLSF
jgi:hypothetical protein